MQERHLVAAFRDLQVEHAGVKFNGPVEVSHFYGNMAQTVGLYFLGPLTRRSDLHDQTPEKNLDAG
jgi:hypothetical protein